LKTRQATYYVLRDRDVVKMVLSGVIDNHSHTHKRGF
jgi:hypothetical protein